MPGFINNDCFFLVVNNKSLCLPYCVFIIIIIIIIIIIYYILAFIPMCLIQFVHNKSFFYIFILHISCVPENKKKLRFNCVECSCVYSFHFKIPSTQHIIYMYMHNLCKNDVINDMCVCVWSC